MADYRSHNLIEQRNCEKFDSQNDSFFSFPEEKSTITLLAVNPGLGFIEWQVQKDIITEYRRRYSTCFNSNRILIKVYDATDINFNGYNAKKEYDIEVAELSGCYYLKIKNVECNLMAEVGFLLSDGKFVPCARSNTMFFNNSQKLASEGTYGGHAFNQVASSRYDSSEKTPQNTNEDCKVENATLSVAVFLNENALSSSHEIEGPVSKFLGEILPLCKKDAVNFEVFKSTEPLSNELKRMNSIDRVFTISMRSIKQFQHYHQLHPFQCVQCHDWYSVPAALVCSSANKLPLITVFHSLEIERAARIKIPVSRKIESWERRAIDLSEMVVVSGEATKKLLVEHYGKSAAKIVVIEDSLSIQPTKKNSVVLPYNLDDRDPFLLFAGEMSPYTGADLVVEALPNVCREYGKCLFVFAGDGRLKGELEKRAWDLGVGQRCRFPGDVKSDIFKVLLEACYAVMIPSRIKHGHGLADMAKKAGKQILATHQAGLDGVIHGVNGYLVYDNPGSMCWGIKEILSRPLFSDTDFRSKSVGNPELIAQLYLEQWTNVVSGNFVYNEEKSLSGNAYNILSLS